MLTIQNNRIISENGTVLKTLSCPFKISDEDLDQTNSPKSRCRHCERTVVNTDYLTEGQLVKLLENDPSTCLKISRYNPIFRVIE